MPMTDQKVLGNQRWIETKQAEFLKDEPLAAVISAYLDGELEGKDLRSSNGS